MEGRPTSLYICSNSGESSLSANSAHSLISLIGWLAGTLFSGFTKVSIVLCGRSYPRIFLSLLNSTALVLTIQLLTSDRSDRRGIFQHPAKNQLAGCAPMSAVFIRLPIAWIGVTA